MSSRMLDEFYRPAPQPLEQPTHATRPVTAAIDLYALVRSLPADGQMSVEDAQLLSDWAERYHDTPLPSRDYLWDTVTRSLGRRGMPADERSALYLAVDSSLPRQLQRAAQRQRLLAEVRDAKLSGQSAEFVSFDFLLAGSHLTGYRERIQSRLAVRTPVRFARETEPLDANDRIRVELETGACVGFVPVDDAPSIAEEFSVLGAAEGVVKKVLTDGLFPIVVIGTRIPYTGSMVDVPVEIETWREPHENSLNARPPKSRLSALTRALGATLKPVTNLFR